MLGSKLDRAPRKKAAIAAIASAIARWFCERKAQQEGHAHPCAFVSDTQNGRGHAKWWIGDNPIIRPFPHRSARISRVTGEIRRPLWINVIGSYGRNARVSQQHAGHVTGPRCRFGHAATDSNTLKQRQCQIAVSGI